MSHLHEKHPQVYEAFQHGLHPVRRSDREWAGLWADLGIEQELMHSLKTSGGLTRGTGMSELQRAIWVLSRPACAQVNICMQHLTGVHHNSSEQVLDMSVSRQQRDFKDTESIKLFLNERNPFAVPEILVNIATGVHAGPEVNVEQAHELGEDILRKMNERRASEYSCKRNDQAVTMSSKNSIRIKNEAVQIYPNLMFQRLASTIVNSDTNLGDALKHELCTFPPALFETTGVLNNARKPQLAEALSSMVVMSSNMDQTIQEFVIDGGSLIQRIPWERQSTIKNIMHKYVEYVRQNYGSPTVVFDGYGSPSTKDMTHRQCKKGLTGVEVTLHEESILMTSKELFLSNSNNKSQIISLIGQSLTDMNCRVKYAKGDADVLISLTAVELAKVSPVTVVGDDTDLLVLLLHHTSEENNEVTLRPQQRSSKTKVWLIKEIKKQLPKSITDNILFIHAVLGCDTTSRLQGIGKGVGMKKLEKLYNLQV